MVMVMEQIKYILPAWWKKKLEEWEKYRIDDALDADDYEKDEDIVRVG